MSSSVFNSENVLVPYIKSKKAHDKVWKDRIERDVISIKIEGKRAMGRRQIAYLC